MIFFAFFALAIITRYGFGRVIKYMLIGVSLFAMLIYEVNLHDAKVEAEHRKDATHLKQGDRP